MDRKMHFRVGILDTVTTELFMKQREGAMEVWNYKTGGTFHCIILDWS